MPDEQQENDPAMEELTMSQAAKEFKISRASLNYWVRKGQIAGRRELSELGVVYWLVRRGEVSKFLANRPKRGRPIKRKKPNA